MAAYTVKKKINFLTSREIQKGAVAKPYRIGLKAPHI
jgi:hypothetical protein